MKESAISKAIIAKINRMPNGRAIKMHSSAAQGAGEPDVFACVYGRMVLIETKVPGEKPTPLQSHILHEWRKAGALAITATSVADVLSALIDEGLYP